ncbi:low-affinity glucose transporter Hxt3p [[Candida] jaroonii]|uniref:Low-affinity glucose transporter Hxt3p n=1 Tax=[Candida] jaroonii TaxID=467808 RepID=A0ACA9YFX2_9ASCO|nr:low-affinity glucose transporter Hxt3p [[Candida] jaroonii]
MIEELNSSNSRDNDETLQLLEHPQQVNNVRIHVAALIASFAAMVIGYEASSIGGTVTLSEFNKEFFENADPDYVKGMKANIISLFHVGAFFGSYFVYPLSIYLGSLWSFKLSGLLIVFGSGLQLGSQRSTGLTCLVAGRIIAGVGVGAISNQSCLYIGNISPSNLRGRLLAFYEINWQVGGILGFFINYATNRNLSGNLQWKVPIAVQLIPAGLFFAGSFLLKEAPRWLFSKGRNEEGIKSLTYYRGLPEDSPYILQEIAHMNSEIVEHKKNVGSEFWGPFKILFGNSNLRFRLFLTTLLFVMQNTTGINAIVYYSVSILKTIGISSEDAGLLSTGVFGLIKGTCCVLWAFFVIDRFGRRKSILGFGSICIVSLFYIGAYIKLADPEHTLNGKSTAGSRTALAFFYIWTVGYGFSWSGFPWCYMSEVFDSRVRNLAQCFNASANWLWAFVFARYAQNMIDAMNYGIFLFFGALLTIATFAFFFLYPETKDFPIHYVDLLFDRKVPAWRAHARALEIIHTQPDAEVVPGENNPFDKPDDIYIDSENSAGSTSKLI